LITYIVYEQKPPVPNPRRINRFGEYDKRGEFDDCSANLVPIGHVSADSNAEAWEKAKRMTKKPVLEEVKQ